MGARPVRPSTRFQRLERIMIKHRWEQFRIFSIRRLAKQQFLIGMKLFYGVTMNVSVHGRRDSAVLCAALLGPPIFLKYSLADLAGSSLFSRSQYTSSPSK